MQTRSCVGTKITFIKVMQMKMFNYRIGITQIVIVTEGGSKIIDVMSRMTRYIDILFLFS